MENKDWLTAKEAREYFGISKSTLYQWRKDGRFELKENYQGKRFGYLYKRDENLKNLVEMQKEFDKRWNK